MTFAIRSASEADHGHCRRMMPWSFPVIGRLPEFLVGEDADGIAGVCATAWLPRGFPVSVQVEERARRKGLGKALITAAASLAHGETESLRPWGRVEQHSIEAKFLNACGFLTSGYLQVFELEPTKLRQSISSLAARARKRVPAEARIVRPRDAPREQLLELVGSNLTTPRPFLEDALFDGGAQKYDQDLSHVIVVGDEVAGAILAHRVGDAMEVDLNVVDPAWRGGWVNLVQVDAVLQGGFAAGLQRLRFLAAPHVKNTINIASRGEGTRLPDLLTMVLPLARSYSRAD